MSVEPGFGGQKFMPESLPKIRAIREYANSRGIDIDIEVDGGITPDNVKYITAAGANVAVAGSAIFNADKPSEVIAKMKEQAKLYPFGSNPEN
jgi:ribulose-phosphate 3-epimerase